jgi:hypothetical protein
MLICSGVLLAAVVLLASACASDPCKKQTCLNNGTCIDGTCYCPEGYEGEHCETKKAACATPPTCLNGGINNATCGCNCPSGFSGNLCEVDNRPACVKNHTGTITIANQYGHDLKVFIDGREIAIIHTGETTAPQEVSVGSHVIKAEHRLCITVLGQTECTWQNHGQGAVTVNECEEYSGYFP